MPAGIEFGIVEMGASAPGEIAALCRIAKPDYGIVTNIGKAHLEGFGDEEGVKAAKGEALRPAGGRRRSGFRPAGRCDAGRNGRTAPYAENGPVRSRGG